MKVYKNGVYNGLVFAETIMSPTNAQLRLRIEGPTFSIRNANNGSLLTGFLAVGPDGLTNVQAFPPALPDPEPPSGDVPEPATLAMLLFGLASIGMLRRRS